MALKSKKHDEVIGSFCLPLPYAVLLPVTPKQPHTSEEELTVLSNNVAEQSTLHAIKPNILLYQIFETGPFDVWVNKTTISFVLRWNNFLQYKNEAPLNLSKHTESWTKFKTPNGAKAIVCKYLLTLSSVPSVEFLLTPRFLSGVLSSLTPKPTIFHGSLVVSVAKKLVLLILLLVQQLLPLLLNHTYINQV